MKLAFYIAQRYLVSKKSVNIINIISLVAMIGVAIVTIALVLILSVYNGLNNMIEKNTSIFDPDLKITSAEGKSFRLQDAGFTQIKAFPEITSFSETIEENALLRYNGRQTIATVKGVPDNYDQLVRLDTTAMTAGQFILKNNSHEFVVLGQGIALSLSANYNFMQPIQFYAPKKGVKQIGLNPTEALISGDLFASGEFAIQQEIDSKYVLVPFDFAQELFGMEDRVNAVELRFAPNSNIGNIQQKVQTILGSRFVVKNQYQQHETLFRLMKSERWAIVAILSFILIIASFNILGSLSTLIIDKKHDIVILRSMGASDPLIRRIFLFEGWLISLLGSFIGLTTGVAIAWLQLKYGLVRLPSDGTYIADAYPVAIQVSDLFLIFAIVATIGFIASWYPIRYINEKYLTINE